MNALDPSPDDLTGPSLPAHLYVHVPFCSTKCSYCDFASVSGASGATVHAVFTGIRTQITRWGAIGLPGVVDTVYIGGGTPSCHPEHVVSVLDHIADHLPLRADAEVTVEGNPDSLSAGTVAAFAQAGATRVSVGVQSFDDGVLRMLGRRHDARAAWEACRRVTGAGLELSLDLMCGIPEQTVTSWSESLARAVETDAGHISVYPLSVEDGTPLSVAFDTGLVSEPDSDMAAEMMLIAQATLGLHGFERYEVANYAKGEARRSRHNTAYWTGRSYMGVGPAAHGMVDAATARVLGLLDADDSDVERVRYANAADIEDWLFGRGDTRELLTSDEAAREDVMLGMRLSRGVSTRVVDAAGLSGVFAAMASDALVELEAGSHAAPRWHVTTRGWLLGNEVFGRIWAGE